MDIAGFGYLNNGFPKCNQKRRKKMSRQRKKMRKGEGNHQDWMLYYGSWNIFSLNQFFQYDKSRTGAITLYYVVHTAKTCINTPLPPVQIQSTRIQNKHSMAKKYSLRILCVERPFLFKSVLFSRCEN